MVPMKFGPLGGSPLRSVLPAGLLEVGVDNPVHLCHTGSLAEVDVGTHGISAAPLVDDKQAEGLDIGKAGLVHGLHDEANGLASEVLGGS